MRFLLPYQVVDLLKAGRPIELWLGHTDTADYRAIRWLSLQRGKDGNFEVSVSEVFDEGSPQMRDVYSFAPLDPDLLGGEVSSFGNVDEALDFVTRNGGNPAKFVGSGMIQDVYAAFLEEHGPAPQK